MKDFSPGNPLKLISANLPLSMKRKVADASRFLSDCGAIGHYPQIEKLLLDYGEEIEELANAKSMGVAQTSAFMEDRENALAVLLVKVSESDLYPFSPGFSLRRHLTLLALERGLQMPATLSNTATVEICRGVRGDLMALGNNPRHQSQVPSLDKIDDFVDWMNGGGISQYSAAFRQYWNSTYKSFAESLQLREVIYVDHIIDSALDGGTERTTDNTTRDGFEIEWHLPEDPAKGLKRSPGTQRVISEAQIATITKIRNLSTNSTSVLTDDEMKSEINNTYERIAKFNNSRLRLKAETEISRLLIAASGISESQIPNLKWMSIGQTVPSPAGVSLDGRWLIHPRYMLQEQESSINQQNATTVEYGACICLPEALSQMLLELGKGRQSGSNVFQNIHTNGGVVRSPSKIPSTYLRRTFISRIARLEPLGISGAQWATNDSLGISEAPLHYDVIEAKYLARQIQRITFPWFGDEKIKLTYKPEHLLGTLSLTIGNDIKNAYLNKDIVNYTGNRRQDLISIINARANNIVVGLIAITGHRPNNNIAKLTLHQFDLVEGICILSDKAVSSNWLHRPAALALPIVKEIESLVANLNELLSILTPSSLYERIRQAITGEGPLFLVIGQGDDVRPYDKSDYLNSIDMEVAGKENFARRYLNQYLIPKLPEALRVGQMGWHGQREGCWGELSPWSVKSACAQIQPALNDLLKKIGWKPYEKAIGFTSKRNSLNSIDWLEIEQSHQREYRAAIYREQKREAERQDAYIATIKDNIARAINEVIPDLVMTDNSRLEWVDGKKPIIEILVNNNIVDKIVKQAILQCPDNSDRKVIRNFIIALLRGAKTRQLVIGEIPSRYNLSLNRGLGWYNNSCLISLQTFRELENWLIFTKNGLSLQAKTTIGLLLYGGYPDISVIANVLHKKTKIVRSRQYPNCVIAEPVDSTSTLVFHDIAAVVLMTWHRNKIKFNNNLEQIEAEIHSLLPAKMKPIHANQTFAQLMAFVRIRNSITMDGVARYVGCGRVDLTTASSARIVGALEDRPVQDYREFNNYDAVHTRLGAGRHVSEKKSVSNRTVVSIITKQNRRFLSGEITEGYAISTIRSELVGILNKITTELTIAYLLARYCVALIDEGGSRKRKLKLSTMLSYIEPLSQPLAMYFKGNALKNNWQEIFNQIIASIIQSARPAKHDALARFYRTINKYFDIPEVDFEILSEIAGAHQKHVNPGYLTHADCAKIAESLSKDISDLESSKASSKDIYIAKVAHAYFLARITTSLRTGEGLSLNISDVISESASASITVRRNRKQRLKTENARRRIFLQGPFATQAANVLSDLKIAYDDKYLRINKKSIPLFRQFNNGLYIDKELLIDRINERVRWVTNNPNATIYFARKLDVWRNMTAYQISNPSSLWPLLDLLVRFGHGDISTTLTSYCHDPFLVFGRWFRSSSHYSTDHLCWATGRSKSYLYHRKGGQA